MMVLPSMRAWYEQHIAQPKRDADQRKAEAAKARRKAPVVRTPVTEQEASALGYLAGVVYPVGSFDKRFARDLHNATALTDAQRACMWGMVWRYRRQIPDKLLVDTARAKTEAGRV